MPTFRPIQFGPYLMLERLAIGGMAEVWLAKQRAGSSQEKLVALKRILPNISEDQEFISMFNDEARIAGQLAHANIAQIFDVGKIGQSCYIALEYVPGIDLRTLWDRVRMRGGGRVAQGAPCKTPIGRWLVVPRRSLVAEGGRQSRGQ